MWSIKKILVPTDFSQPSEAALEAAIDLAKKFGASIVLLHTYQVPIYAYPTAPMVPVAELTSSVEEAANKALAASARAYAKSGVTITTALHVGIPWEEILRAAKQHEVNVIVMGSRGLRGLPRALMGSTAEKVVRYSQIPVMTLHGEITPAADISVNENRARVPEDPIDRWIS